MAERVVDDDDIYREIESIIDCYLKLPDASESENERGKRETVASYFLKTQQDLEMELNGFF
jgi:hypothetical protein